MGQLGDLVGADGLAAARDGADGAPPAAAAVAAAAAVLRGRGLGAGVARGLALHLLRVVPVGAGGLLLLLLTLLRGVRRRVGLHLALLQELLGVQRVEGPQVVDHGHQLGKYGGVVRVLGQQDGVEDHLQLGLHPLDQVGVAETGAVCKIVDESTPLPQTKYA